MSGTVVAYASLYAEIKLSNIIVIYHFYYNVGVIPDIIHQVFVSSDKLVDFPKEWQRYAKQAQKLHPKWQYMYWDAKSLREFITKYYKKCLPYFENHIPAVVQSDIGRYLILHTYGGWYLDFDYELLKPLDIWQDNDLILPYARDTELGTEYTDTTWDSLEDEAKVSYSNAILASKPKHPLWEKMITSLPPASFYSYDMHAEHILKTTGPAQLTKVYSLELRRKNLPVLHPKREVFHTPLPKKMSFFQYHKLKNNDNVWGLHHTHSSWRDHELQKNLNRRKYYSNILMRPLILLRGLIKRRYGI